MWRILDVVLYMDEFLLKLKESRIGCDIGNTVCGARCNTHMIWSLLCPKLSSLKVMLGIADEFDK